ncbi:SEC-C domain-containing protein [Pseudomonas sp. LA21]|uniref:nuclease-related domain-containing protein n=1 Tax=unclassified Pseudomonas TaxID=196821 RepID=UPI001FB5E563|nr:nuclease-related domain-containing protein [Pseudomonas sp. LA21]MCJ1886491.1 SEC-C domain-containing protein [Pseudomonas sp. LA21]
MGFTGRSESEVFADLVALTAQPGYAYAIALICHRDNLVAYREEYTTDDLSDLYDPKRLIRTEINTLLGLMMRHPLDLSLPEPNQIQTFVARSDELMAELHDAMSGSIFASLIGNATDMANHQAWDGVMMREPIFYGSESAYSFQYRDFFVDKHSCDDDWLRQNKGFTSRQAQQVARAMCSSMDSRASKLYQAGKGTKVAADALLAHFEFTAEEVSQKTGLDIDIVQAVFDALTFTGCNAEFHELGDYNSVAATPLLPTGRGSVLLFMHYAIYEALYESPFFWMNVDPLYRQQASDNRGAFVEQFAHKRLAAVFGAGNVFTNVNLIEKNIVGEADVLVIFGDRMIIVQAKAKKLTLAARKGNDGQLKKDFAAAIQKASDQAWECANAILSGKCRMVDDKGMEITPPQAIKEIYPFCVVSDHYPALAFQASQYLEYQTTDVVQPPLVMDVFLLDVLTEMLDTPLHLLSYVRLRSKAAKKLMLSHELTALAYHLHQNLWLEPELSMISLDDSIAGDLDVAMTVRREAFPGKRTPPGILTHMQGTLYERLIMQIERRAEAGILELGFGLLSMDGQSCRNIHNGLAGIAALAVKDGKRHDFTFVIGDGKTGITFHCNPNPDSSAINDLQLHCEKRKYAQRASMWFGVSLSPEGDIQFGMTYDKPWTQSDAMDELTKGMKNPLRVGVVMKTLERGLRVKKPGRNDSCQCGSGKKYKKCCLP